MRGFSFLLTTVVFAVLASYLTVTYLTPHHKTSVDTESKKQSAYERVMETGKIRCGYGLWEPGLMQDPNTGEIYGVFADLTEALGKSLGLEIEWTAEIDWGQVAQALQSKKIDMMCAGLWASGNRGRQIGFSNALFYTTVDVIGRAGDTRFDNCLECLNDPNIIIATNDGDVSQEIALRDFPKAKQYAKVQIAGEDILLMNVMSGKADVTFTNRIVLRGFDRNNPGKLRRVPTKPLRIYANTFGVEIHEHEFLEMVNTGVDELVLNGLVDIALKKIDMDGVFLGVPSVYTP